MAPNKNSAAAAVETLRAGLDMMDRELDHIDQKTALLPVVVGTIAGLLISPAMTFTLLQGAILAVALGTGGMTILLSLTTMRPRLLNLGPNAKTTAYHTHLKPEDFQARRAGAPGLVGL